MQQTPQIESKGPRFIEVAHSVVRPAGIENQVFIRLDDLDEWHKKQLDIELYSSVFRFYSEDPYVGGVLASFPMDFDDANNVKRAKKEALVVCRYLMNVLDIKEEDISICFSGNKGFHIFVNHEVFGGKREKGPLKPHVHLPKIFKNMAKDLVRQHGLKTLDLNIYDRRRLMRLENSRHPTSELYKIPLSLSELETLNVDAIRARATKKKTPLQRNEHTFSKKAGRWYKKHYDKFMKWLEQRKAEFTNADFEVGEIWPCVKKRLEIGAEKGERNACTWQLATYFYKKGVPLNECLQTLKVWHTKLDQSRDFRSWEDCERTIRKVYEVKGYGIGCGSEFIHELCIGKENCPHFVKREKTQIAKETLEKAENILTNNPLKYVADTINQSHVGDRELIQTAYISALSPKLAKISVNLWPIGSSQTGKSDGLKNVIKALPRELYEVFTSASPKSLFYFAKKHGENCFDGRLIYIDEVESSRLTIPMLRSLTSQIDIEPRHLSVHEAELLDLKIKGRRSVWFTSVKPFGGEQIRNRFIFVNPDETEEQDKRVFQKQDEIYRQGKTIDENAFEIVKGITKQIVEHVSNLKVVIPYEIEWPYEKRRWLYPFFLAFIETITKINYKKREINGETIVATPEDFRTAQKLWSKFIEHIIYRVSKPARDLLENLFDDRIRAKTKAKLSEELGVSTQRIGKILEELEEAQLVSSQTQPKDKGRPAKEYWKNPLPSTDDIKIKQPSL